MPLILHMWDMVDCATVFKTRAQKQLWISLPSFQEVADHIVNTWKRLKNQAQVILACYFCISDFGNNWTCWQNHLNNLLSSSWPDRCWYFYCHSLVVIYAAFDFCDGTLRLHTPHGRRAEGCGAGCSTEGQYTLAQIFWRLSRITKASLIQLQWLAVLQVSTRCCRQPVLSLECHPVDMYYPLGSKELKLFPWC